MVLTPEQVKELKRQLSEQINHLPENQKAQAQKQIDDMSAEAIESMLREQQSQQGPDGAQQQPQEIYRAIVSGQIPSKKLDENKSAIAVLDIKPISKGHTIVIPKTPVKDAKEMPDETFALAKKIAKKISSELKTEGTEIQTQFAFGEIILNVIPIYDKPLSINSPRSEAKEEELQEIYQKLRTVKKPKVIKIKKSRQTKIIKRPRKIP